MGRWRVTGGTPGAVWLALQETEAKQAECALSDHFTESRDGSSCHQVRAMSGLQALTLLAMECLQFSSCDQDINEPEITNTLAGGKAALAPSPAPTKVGASPCLCSRQEAQSRTWATKHSHL